MTSNSKDKPSKLMPVNNFKADQNKFHETTASAILCAMPCPIVHSKNQNNWIENKPCQHLLIIFATFMPISFLVCSHTGKSPIYMSKKAPARKTKEEPEFSLMLCIRNTEVFKLVQ